MAIRVDAYDAFPMLAGGSVTPNRIVKIGSADDTVVLAAAATDKAIGVSGQNITTATGGVVDVYDRGTYEVVAGASITRGDRICADAAGAGVPAAPAAGTNNFVIGIALASAASGDLVSVRLCPGVLQG